VSLKELTAEVLCWDENGDRCRDRMNESGIEGHDRYLYFWSDRFIAISFKANSVPDQGEEPLMIEQG
jgi:hypothetical protein